MVDVHISREDIDKTMATLPSRLVNERLADWLQRAKQPIEADFLCHAANAGDELLPLPQYPLETERFRLTVVQIADELEITLQTQGESVLDEFANSVLELIDASTLTVFAELTLNIKGCGQVRIADNEANRRALQHPQLRRRV
jgi:hypothetical protein